MQALGIIAEYNPFHNGHLHQLQESKKRLGLPVIAVISGSIMQRGEPAFADKWLRASLALANGVDLVLELPAAFCLRSAEHFARGGIKLLQATGIVTHLSCGAENAEIDYSLLARKALSPATQEKLHSYLEKGCSYAKACELALGTYVLSADHPNNILALEYAKALLGTDIRQLTVPRLGNAHQDASISTLASATAIRKAYAQGADWEMAVPPATASLLRAHASRIGYAETKLWQLLQYRLTASTSQELAEHCCCGEGLENLLQAAARVPSFAEAVAFCTSKRYPSSHIRRLLLQLLLNLPHAYYEQETPAYLRVLGFNDCGRKLLSTMKETATLPVLTKLGKHPWQQQSEAFAQQLRLDLRATDVTELLRFQPLSPAADYLLSPCYHQT